MSTSIQKHSDNMVNVSFKLTKDHEFKSSYENIAMLNLFIESFAIHCGSIRFKKLISAVRIRNSQK